MGKENLSQKFRLENIDETRNYFVEKIQQNELMSRKHKKACTTLNYIEHFLILVSAVTGCISISAFCFFSQHCYRNYEFSNRIKNFCRNLQGVVNNEEKEEKA